MEIAIGIVALLVLLPCLPELRSFVKGTLKEINSESTPAKK